MHFPSQLFHPDLLQVLNVLATFGLFKVLYAAPWRALVDTTKINAWLGGSIVVAMFWVLRAVVQDGLTLHMLGATVLTLMVGPWLALLGLGIVLLALTILGLLDAGCLGLHWLLLGGLPVGVSYILLRLGQRYLPSNYFIYIFVNAFMGAALSMLAVGVATAWLYQLIGLEPAGFQFGETVLYFLLMGWAEAFTSGTVMTLIVVYCPQWSVTFDDARYLSRRS
ncbi:energy-coupling factor ABC transporter permease [Chitinivorax sp. B]|uniref:energy-coupling factor ABC transporter permease n=1 Tax=Chitinivorax sp. B TaxID=2502235 RepID=UPI0010F66FD5|nr:energy-coupling factor ABC transporter permease [Chitinivorax sp. B]